MKTVSVHVLDPLENGMFPAYFEMELPKGAKIIATAVTEQGLEISVVANPNKPLVNRLFTLIEEGDEVRRNYEFRGVYQSIEYPINIYLFEAI